MASLREWFDALRRLPVQDVVGINRRNAELIYPNNDRRNFRYADDKLLAKVILQAAGVPVPVTLAVCDGLYAVDQTVEALSAHEAFVVKPSQSSGGVGILVLTGRTSSGAWLTPGGSRVDRAGLRRHLADIVFGAYGNRMSDTAYAETMVRPHPFFRTLWAEGLSDVRILAHDGVPFMAMLRVPTRASEGRANLHQGGIGVAVQLETGCVSRALWRGMLIERHPESGADLLGLEIPSWARILDVARLAASAVPLGYLGVDIVVDTVGQPLVLEVNVRPGLEIQNVHGESIEVALRRARA